MVRLQRTVAGSAYNMRSTTLLPNYNTIKMR